MNSSQTIESSFLLTHTFPTHTRTRTYTGAKVKVQGRGHGHSVSHRDLPPSHRVCLDLWLWLYLCSIVVIFPIDCCITKP